MAGAGRVLRGARRSRPTELMNKRESARDSAPRFMSGTTMAGIAVNALHPNLGLGSVRKEF